MAKPTRSQKRKLGPLVAPFERHNRIHPEKKRQMGPGEDQLVSWAIYDASEDGLPGDVQLTDHAVIDETNKYIWVITTAGLFMVFESTKGPNRNRSGLCHSNITGGKKAYQGGELWFLRDNSVVINFYSGRYGAENKIQERAVVDYFHSVGYETVLVDTERV